ncbi:MAG: hypothetical protein K5657_04390 [Desulfovibrio sp.]|nr:hypothetical protein [Desulfovibrio sp.]
MDRFFRVLHETLYGFLAMQGGLAQAHTRLYTDDGDGVLVADDASLVSLLRFDGSIRLIGEEEFSHILCELTTLLSRPLQKPCHALQCVFDYDPAAGSAGLAPQFSSIIESARTLHLDLENVLLDWQEKLGSYCAAESVYLAFWTRPGILSRSDRKKEKARLSRRRLMAASSVQGKDVRMEGMRHVHRAQVESLLSFFREMNIKVRLLDCKSAVMTIRGLLLGPSGSRFWEPQLSAGERWPMAPESGQSPHDYTNLLPKTLAGQIWPDNVRIIGGRFVRVGTRLYAPFLMSLPPKTVLPFNRLFQSMKGLIPWRAAFLITGDGLGKSGLKSMLAQILSFAARENVMQGKAFNALREAELSGQCAVGFQAVFVTWVEGGGKDVQALLEMRRARFQSQIEAWGSAETRNVLGDPLLGLTAAIPCAMPGSPAPKAVAPLGEALCLLPLTRTSSPFDHADLPLRTPDGKFMPIGLFHSLQASWNEVVFAGMGAGKSFFLNTLNFFFILRNASSRLPWLTVIDIGPSSGGVITLIKWALPPHERGKACFAKLKNSARHAINPFDTPLGCPYPLRHHAEFLNNLLSLLCTPLERTTPADGMAELLREATDTLYRRMAPDGERPRRFDGHADRDLTTTLRRMGFPLDAQTSWWDVVLFLFREGDHDRALKAQRFAVPLLSDLASCVTEHNVAENFTGITVGSGAETVPLAASRYLIGALSAYPVLANPSSFSLGGAQIIGLDLSEVTPRGGAQAERQSGIMYMLARFVGAGHFFMSTDDLCEIPLEFRDYHRPRLEHLMADPKRLCYDEFHRASCQDMNNPLSRQIISDLTTATRESRKLNLSIGLCSQRLADFPPELVAMATSVYALGAGNAREARDIAERFGYNEAARDALRRITRPRPSGAEFVALYRTALGESIQYLTNSAGSYARWAFSTTAEDMRLRNRLYDILGCRRALDILVAHYPEGSVKEELERRSAARIDGEEGGEDFLERICAELLEKAEGT